MSSRDLEISELANQMTQFVVARLPMDWTGGDKRFRTGPVRFARILKHGFRTGHEVREMESRLQELVELPNGNPREELLKFADMLGLLVFTPITQEELRVAAVQLISWASADSTTDPQRLSVESAYRELRSASASKNEELLTEKRAQYWRAWRDSIQSGGE